jgi:hypothetical protein
MNVIKPQRVYYLNLIFAQAHNSLFYKPYKYYLRELYNLFYTFLIKNKLCLDFASHKFDTAI